MDLFLWILLSGLAMSAIALVGSVTLILSASTLDRILLPLVAFAAGSLLGGALFHMVPQAVASLGSRTAVWVWVTAGFVAFLVPLAAGNFLYIGASDLIPEIKATHDLPTSLVHLVSFAAGLGILLAIRATG